MKGFYIMHHSPTRRNTRGKSSTPIYIGQRVIGAVIGDCFHKSILGSKHMLRRPPAICSDRSALRDAAAAGATRIEVLDRETHITYTISFDTIDANSFPVHRGHGDQVAVTLDHWAINGATPVAVAKAAQTNQERKELQMTLFGGVGR